MQDRKEKNGLDSPAPAWLVHFWGALFLSTAADSKIGVVGWIVVALVFLGFGTRATEKR